MWGEGKGQESLSVIHPSFHSNHSSSSLQPLTIRYTTFNISLSAVVSLPIERTAELPTLFVN